MMKRLVPASLALVAAMLLAPSPATAQEGNEADRARIEELERRVVELQMQLDSVLAGQSPCSCRSMLCSKMAVV